jgi:hypothetical protein
VRPLCSAAEAAIRRQRSTGAPRRDHACARRGRDAPHAELGRLLDDEIHPVALEEGGREDQIERATRALGGGVATMTALGGPVGDA